MDFTLGEETMQFENTHKFEEEEFQEIDRIFSKRTRLPRYLALALLAVACFFTAYTLLIGIGLTVLLTLNLLNKKILRFANRNAYRESKILKLELTYGLTDKKLWLSGEDYSAEISWKMIKVWDLRDSWLYVACDQTPRFYFSIEKLKENGIFEDVVDLCKSHAPLFDSSDSRRRLEELYPEKKEEPNQSAHTTPASAPR